MLYRIGRKQKLAKKIIQYFPEHNIYIEPFFGAGGLFFNKPKTQYNFINDYNKDVYNLFMVLKNQNKELLEALNNLPIDQTLFNYWKITQEHDPILKALRFIFLSNFSFLGKSDIISLVINNHKKLALSRIPLVNELLEDVIITSFDFELFLKKITFRRNLEREKAFIYADPPYANRYNNYELKWEINDSARLFLILSKMNIRFAISELESDLTLYLANHFNLKINVIGDVKRLSSTRKEILITNY
jgi:DNA adenine methylase